MPIHAPLAPRVTRTNGTMQHEDARIAPRTLPAATSWFPDVPSLAVTAVCSVIGCTRRVLCQFSMFDSLEPVVTTESSSFEERNVREFTIGQLSKLSGVNIETIRYYEKIGIIPHPPRNSSGYRIFSTPHLERLSFVRRSRELGFSQPEVRKLLTLVDKHKYTCAEVQEITARQLAAVRTKIKDLRKLEKALADMVSVCDGGDIPDCPIVDILSGVPEPKKQRRNCDQ